MSREVIDKLPERPPEFRQNSLLGGGLSRRTRFGLFVCGFLLVLVSLPLSPLMLIIGFIVQHRAKTRLWTRIFPFVLLAVAVVVGLVFGHVWTDWAGAILKDAWASAKQFESPLHAFSDHTSGMIPAWIVAGVVIGIPVGLLYAWWDWFRTPQWRVRDKKRTMSQVLRMGVHRRMIERGSGRGSGEVVYGLENDKYDSGAVVSQRIEDMLHTMIFGTTGSGKTQTLFRILFAFIEDSLPVFVIDLKGSKTTYETLEAKAEAEGRTFYGFTLNGPSHYDPFRTNAGTNATKQKDLFISAEEWSDEHYKGIAESFLLTLFKALEVGGPLPGKSVLASCGVFLNEPNELAKYARTHLSSQEHQDLNNQVMIRVQQVNENPQSISGLVTKISRIVESVAGSWISPEAPHFTLREAWEENAVVVFSLPNMAYPMLSATLAAFVLQDLKALAAEIQDMPKASRKPWAMAVDEFAKANTTALETAIAQVRESEARVVLAEQSLKANAADKQNFMDGLWNQATTKIVHNVDIDTAERFCRVAGPKWGTEKSHDTNEQDGLLDIDRGGLQNRGRAKPVKVDRIDPSRFATFEAGEFAMMGPMLWRAGDGDSLGSRLTGKKVPKQTLVKQCRTVRDHLAIQLDTGVAQATVADGELAEAEFATTDAGPEPGQATGGESEVPDALLTEAERAERAGNRSETAETASTGPQATETGQTAPPPPPRAQKATTAPPPPPNRQTGFRDTRDGYQNASNRSAYADEWFDDEP